MFKKSYHEICKMKAQEQDGLKDFNYQTERERLNHVAKELIAGTHKRVTIYKDELHPTIIHISNGFHRIYMWKRLSDQGELPKKMKCNVWYGYWVITNSIEIRDLAKVLDMISKMGAGDITINRLKKGLRKKAKANQEKGVLKEFIGY